MGTGERAALYRQRAAEFEQKASTARTEQMRRAWMILARDWKMMALDVELKFLDAPESKLSPDSVPEESLEEALARLMHASVTSGAS
jgi:hypothetical protein